MNENNVLIAIGVIGLLVALFFGWYLLFNNSSSPSSLPGNLMVKENENAEGTLYISLTDAAIDTKKISNIEMTIDSIEIYSQGRGWIAVSQNLQAFQLLELQAKSSKKIIATATVPVDIYSQIRVHVSKVTITENRVAKDAALPSSELKIDVGVRVEPDAATYVEFDVLADQSIHKTEKGEFIFTPVVDVEVRNKATVEADAQNTIKKLDGEISSMMNVGMDIDGRVRSDFKVNQNILLKLNGGVIEPSL